MDSSIVPTNVKGKQSNLEYSVTLADREAAFDCFKRAIKRLRNPPVWHKLCGALSASFILVAENGNEAERLAEVNDYFRISIPGPGNATGNGYDWVKVEAIEDNTSAKDDEESFGMRVRPCHNPNNNTNDTAHFFEGSATSTYIVRRNGNVVTAYYHGRNEVANTDTDKTSDNIRNAIVAAGGFMALSEAQWYALIKGLLQEEIGG